MGDVFPVEILSYRDLETYAVDFLAKHHPSGELPTPIEDIIDLEYKVDIIPLEGMYEKEVDAFISRDMRTIYVDQSIYKSENSFRYRFTLAHEFAHRLLHEPVFALADYDSPAAWKEFIASIPDEDRKWIEWQAYALAGLLLVPSEHLTRRYKEVADTLKRLGHDIRRGNPLPTGVDRIRSHERAGSWLHYF